MCLLFASVMNTCTADHSNSRRPVTQEWDYPPCGSLPALAAADPNSMRVALVVDPPPPAAAVAVSDSPPAAPPPSAVAIVRRAASRVLTPPQPLVALTWPDALPPPSTGAAMRPPS